MTKLKRIGAHCNKLEFVSSELLRPIINNGLAWVDFQGSETLNIIFEPGKAEFFEEAQRQSKCGKESKGYVGTSGSLSDSKIILSSKNFVHK